MAKQGSEQTIKIRQVTDVHSNWSSQGPLQDGKFSFQFVLDNGAEEILVMPTAGDDRLAGGVTAWMVVETSLGTTLGITPGPASRVNCVDRSTIMVVGHRIAS